jgi:hypothetical protein
MDTSSPIDAGTVEWSGENPGIYLKDTPDGPWRRLAVFFRVCLSPYGRGHAMLILEDPDKAQGMPAIRNFCITDNEPLSRYLVADFVSNFASFRGKAGLGAMSYLPLTTVRTVGDPRSTYAEIVKSDSLQVEMTWKQLGRTFAASVPPEKSATGKHHMYSLFVEAADGSIAIDGRPLTGSVITRDFLGTRLSTAFLAFSETWVKRV